MDKATVRTINPRQHADIVPVLHGLLEPVEDAPVKDDVDDEWV